LSDDGTYHLIVRSRDDPSEFLAALVSPNLVELREARRAADGAQPPDGFSQALLPVPKYDMMKLPERKVADTPVFLSQSPGMRLHQVKSVRTWTTRTATRDPVISLEFLDRDAERFADLTGRLADGPEGTLLALLIDDRIVTAGVVDQRVEGGRVDLMDVATKEDAALIAAMIEAGPLPHGLTLRAEPLQSPN